MEDNNLGILLAFFECLSPEQKAGVRRAMNENTRQIAQENIDAIAGYLSAPKEETNNPH